MHRYFNKIVLSTHDYYYLVTIDDILYCQSENTYTTFYLTNKEAIKVSTSIKQVEEKLSEENFLRVHRSYLVNSLHIKRYYKIEGKGLLLTNGILIPVSSRKKKNVLHFLEKIGRIQIQ